MTASARPARGAPSATSTGARWDCARLSARPTRAPRAGAVEEAELPVVDVEQQRAPASATREEREPVARGPRFGGVDEVAVDRGDERRDASRQARVARAPAARGTIEASRLPVARAGGSRCLARSAARRRHLVSAVRAAARAGRRGPWRCPRDRRDDRDLHAAGSRAYGVSRASAHPRARVAQRSDEGARRRRPDAEAARAGVGDEPAERVRERRGVPCRHERGVLAVRSTSGTTPTREATTAAPRRGTRTARATSPPTRAERTVRCRGSPSPRGRSLANPAMVTCPSMPELRDRLADDRAPWRRARRRRAGGARPRGRAGPPPRRRHRGPSCTRRPPTIPTSSASAGRAKRARGRSGSVGPRPGRRSASAPPGSVTSRSGGTSPAATYCRRIASVTATTSAVAWP